MRLWKWLQTQRKYYWVRWRFLWYSPEMRGKVLERGMNPKPLPPLPVKRHEPGCTPGGSRGKVSPGHATQDGEGRGGSGLQDRP